MPKNITTLTSLKSNFTWTNIIHARKEQIDYLRKKFKFSELDLRDSYATTDAQRPKFFHRNDYSFLILQFPVFNNKTKLIEAEEVDFFIGEHYLITCHKNKLSPLTDLFTNCLRDKFYKDQYLTGNGISLLYEIISRLQEYCYPILDHISLDIRNIEDNIFKGNERLMVKEILMIKSNVLNFRKIMEAHKDVLIKLSKSKIDYLSVSLMDGYYIDLVEHTRNIWDILSSHKELIEALENTNSSLISFKINDIMRTLTVFSVIVFPLTLLAAIFGMNTVNGMPFMNDSWGFWMIIGIMLVGAFAMYLFFRKKKWI
jgi:magnesium transporter